ncbi:hypothetical protein EDC01DRAFT_621537 [Geopyxis carbonaria]|nr:hypothetical protein EDC01DRAFT_621537 [Geopyxis carbonaria]
MQSHPQPAPAVHGPGVIAHTSIPTLTTLYSQQPAPIAAPSSALAAPSSDLNSRVRLVQRDITKIAMTNGAIVNAANQRLLGGGGVDGAIHRAAGRALKEECRGLGGCETGGAKITDAYALPCRKVIHTVGPVYSAAQAASSRELLTSCYEKCLNLAVENGLDAIAFSAVSTGIYGYPSADAARVAVSTVRKFLDTPKGDTLKDVIFCNFMEKDVNAYARIVPEYFPPRRQLPPYLTSPLRRDNTSAAATTTMPPRLPLKALGGALVSLALWTPALIFTSDHVASLHWVSGRSMSPALTPYTTSTRDLVLCNRWAPTASLHRGQVIVFRTPADPERVAVKRVVALEGDVVRPRPGSAMARVAGLVTVPMGQVWVEGDEGFHSIDSNAYGPIPLGLVVAQVARIVWPLARAGPLAVDEGLARRGAVVARSTVERPGVYRTPDGKWITTPGKR